MLDSTANSTTHHGTSPAVERVGETRCENVLTFSVCDYFQANTFRKVVAERHWDRFESRLETSLDIALDLLDEHAATATFFVLGWTAERHPELVRRIADRGHEVACLSSDDVSTSGPAANQFREHVLRSRSAIENAIGQRVHGHRFSTAAPRATARLLDVVGELGFVYDSSLPTRFSWSPLNRWSPAERERTTANGPLALVPPVELRDAIGQRTDRPVVADLSTWELDPDQPRITAVGPFAKRRHERRLATGHDSLVRALRSRVFGSVAESLALAQERLEVSPEPAATIRIDERPAAPLHGPIGRRERKGVSIVVPCFNEERSIPYLARTLESVRFHLAGAYDPEFVFVDDCSTDATVDVIEATFADEPSVRVVRHETNKGVAAAILTGIDNAAHEIVASIDCDCSYDPHELRRMLPLLTDGVDLVTASPYHPQGTVENVPGWRLFLSRGLSTLYARVLPAKLHTYTSCFRVYRRDCFAGMPLEHDGFLGVAEMLAHAAQRDGGIVEHPATLSVRLFGESKMKTLRCIRGHLGLLAQYAFRRRRRPAPTVGEKVDETTAINAQPLPHGRG